MRPFQNFGFWNGFLGFNRKTGLLTGFSGGLLIEPEVRANRVLEQPQLPLRFFPAHGKVICP
ncbi:MAG: hypothetical protein LBP23_03350, partial [Treponema sp.]|nr:hypothetical protein [Treponema sp.]